MEGTILILTVAAGIDVAVFLLLLSKYLELGARYVAWWAAGVITLTAGAVVEMSTLAATNPVPLTAVRSGLLLAGAGFFLTGSVSRDPRARGIILAAVLGFGVLVFAAVVVLLFGTRDIATAGLIAGLAAGVAFLLAADGYRRGEQILDDLATRAIYAGLIAIGLNLIGWAWAARAPSTIAWRESLGGLCMLAFGGGIELRGLHRARRLVILNQITAVLQRYEAVEALLENVLHRTGDLLQVHTGWIFLRNPRSGTFELAAAYHLPPRFERSDHAAMRGSCRCLDLLQANQLTLPVNIVDCMRLEQVGVRARHATVPLRSSTGIVGLMNLVLPAGRLFGQRDLTLLATVGGALGLAIEEARLRAELREKEQIRSDLIKKLLTAQEDEQRRIARELHDETGQSLTAIILQAESLRARAERGDGEPVPAAELDRLKTLAETALEGLRKLIYDLRPTILDDLGLSAALRWYAHQQLEPRGLSLDLHLQLGDSRLDSALETAVFRIAQEALWNVVKHASATRAEVAIDVGDGRVRLRVKDNGRGFRRGERRQVNPLSGGMGLAGMEERAALFGGTVTVTSTPDAGTEVIAELPLAQPAKAS